MPPAPFSLDGFDLAGVLPQRVYAKGDLPNYRALVLDRSRAQVCGLTPAWAQQRIIGESRNLSWYGRVLYTTRHVQHHAAPPNLLLRQHLDDTPG